MDSLPDELKQALEGRAAHMAAREGHPQVELLAAYHAGELAAERERELQDHLVWCRECTKLLLGLDHLDEVEGAGSSAAEAEGDWRSIHARLPPAHPLRPVRRWSRRRTPRLPYRPLSAIAAVLLLATLGLSVWVVQLRHAVSDLSSPRVNVAVHDLYLADSPRAPDAAQFNQIPATAEAVTLILNASPGIDHPDYMLTIEELDGPEVWRRRGLRPSRWQTFTLTLPGGFLPPGEYRLRLSGLDAGRWTELDEFPLRVIER